jgi:hypothetical protein
MSALPEGRALLLFAEEGVARRDDLLDCFQSRCPAARWA